MPTTSSSFLCFFDLLIPRPTTKSTSMHAMSRTKWYGALIVPIK